MYKVLLLMCASSLPFLFTLRGDFVFDDSMAVVKNEDIFSDTWTSPFLNDFWGTSIRSNLSHKSYRPLTVLSFRLNYLINNKELSPTHFKITNFICHVISCFLVWKTFDSILRGIQYKYDKNYVAFLAALIFGVHPIHVEAICGIVGRADILAAIAFFLAFLSYTKATETTKFTWFYLTGTVLFALVSMLCKENGVTVLGYCIIYDILINFKSEHDKSKVLKPSIHKRYYHLPHRAVKRTLFILLSALLLLYGRWTVMGGTKPEFKHTDNPAAFSNNFYTKILTYNYIYFLNLLLLIWPQWLCYDWSMGCIPLLESIYDYRILFPLLIYTYAVLVIIASCNRKNTLASKRAIILAIALTIIPFLPAANIFFPVGFVIAERILYIPSAGYCLLITLGLNKIILSNKRYKIVTILYTLLICTYGLRSWQRSYDWQHEYQLYINGLTVCPLNAKIHYNVAKIVDANHDSEWALQEYKESIRLYPEYYQAMNNLANLLKDQKQYTEAEMHLRTAIKLKQDFPAAWMNLGIVLASTGRYHESRQAYENALKYRKNYSDCFYNLGNLFLEMNNTKAAKENWFKAVNLNPIHGSAWVNLLALLDNAGQLQEALQVIPHALTHLPDSPAVNFAIANIYGKLNRYEEAEKFFIKTIKLFDKKVKAIHYSNLGVLYHRWKKYELAKEMYRNALQIDPLFQSAHTNLKKLKSYIKE